MKYEEYIREGLPSRREIEVFIHELSWARFDPVAGYILGNYIPHDGIDNSSTISTAQPDRFRTSFLWEQLYAMPSGERRRNLAGISGGTPG
jgi:hypothetical protein